MISRRVRQLRPSGIRQMFERAASLADPIDLSIGQPHFEVPEIVQEAAIAAIRDSRNRYTVTQGIPDLNEKLATWEQFYDFDRPHSAHNVKTPYEALRSIYSGEDESVSRGPAYHTPRS